MRENARVLGCISITYQYANDCPPRQLAGGMPILPILKREAASDGALTIGMGDKEIEQGYIGRRGTPLLGGGPANPPIGNGKERERG